MSQFRNVGGADIVRNRPQIGPFALPGPSSHASFGVGSHVGKLSHGAFP